MRARVLTAPLSSPGASQIHRLILSTLCIHTCSPSSWTTALSRLLTPRNARRFFEGLPDAGRAKFFQNGPKEGRGRKLSSLR
jgi:hypothetical protein